MESDDQKSCVENVREERTQQRNEMMKTGKGRKGKERKGKGAGATSDNKKIIFVENSRRGIGALVAQIQQRVLLDFFFCGSWKIKVIKMWGC